MQWIRLRKYTDEEQNLIDGVEFAIDNGLDIPEEDYEEYRRLTEGRK